MLISPIIHRIQPKTYTYTGANECPCGYNIICRKKSNKGQILGDEKDRVQVIDT